MEGIDFVMKKGSGTCDSLAEGRPLSILHLQGRYLPGETAEQWRGEGFCERMPLTEEMIAKLPSYTITSMLASKRLEKEKGKQVEELHDGVSGVGTEYNNYVAWKCSLVQYVPLVDVADLTLFLVMLSMLLRSHVSKWKTKVT